MSLHTNLLLLTYTTIIKIPISQGFTAFTTTKMFLLYLSTGDSWSGYKVASMWNFITVVTEGKERAGHRMSLLRASGHKWHTTSAYTPVANACDLATPDITELGGITFPQERTP